MFSETERKQTQGVIESLRTLLGTPNLLWKYPVFDHSLKFSWRISPTYLKDKRDKIRLLVPHVENLLCHIKTWTVQSYSSKLKFFKFLQIFQLHIYHSTTSRSCCFWSMKGPSQSSTILKYTVMVKRKLQGFTYHITLTLQGLKTN